MLVVQRYRAHAGETVVPWLSIGPAVRDETRIIGVSVVFGHLGVVVYVYPLRYRARRAALLL